MTERDSPSEDVYASFDRPSSDTADALLNRLGLDNLITKSTEIALLLKPAEEQLAEAKVAYQKLLETHNRQLEVVKELRADQHVIQQAIALARDKDLE